MPRFSSSSSRMMIRGVTISMKLLVVRPMPMLRKRRSIIGILDSDGHAVFRSLLVQRLDAAQEHRAAVGNRHGRGDRVGRAFGKLNVSLNCRRPAAQDRCRRPHRQGT